MSYFIADLHQDLLTESTDNAAALRFLNAECNGKNVLSCCAVWGTELNEFPQQAVSRFRALQQQTKAKLYLTYEDVHYLAGVRDYCALVESAPLSVGLTWNEENTFAGGVNSSAGLTDAGIRLIRALNRDHILLDAAHLNERSFFQLAERTEGAFLVSHACFSEVRPHPRNLTAEQIRTVIASGGVVGLSFVGQFLSESGRATANDVVRHIDYFAEHFPLSALCLGTDFFGTRNLPQNIENYETTIILVEKLLKIGYNINDIHSIFCNNFIAFLRKENYI